MPDIILNDRQICDFELLVTGVFSPLKGFMKQIDYESVLDRMRLESGQLWPVPVCLDISENLASTLETGQSAALRDPEGFLLGIMTIEDLWPLDIEKEALAVYKTLDTTHPGVDYLVNRSGRFYIGGEIQTLSLPIHSDFRQIRNTPAEVRKIFDFGCTHFIIGHDHASPGLSNSNTPFYEYDEATALACAVEKELEMDIIPFEDEYRLVRQSIEAHRGFIEVHVATPLTES